MFAQLLQTYRKFNLRLCQLIKSPLLEFRPVYILPALWIPLTQASALLQWELAAFESPRHVIMGALASILFPEYHVSLLIVYSLSLVDHHLLLVAS